MEWPSKREDDIEGQHFNLTQLPFDVEVDDDGFSMIIKYLFTLS